MMISKGGNNQMDLNRYSSIENIFFTITTITYVISIILYFIFFVSKKDVLGRWASVLLLIGFAFHTASLITRGVGAGRVPLTNQYEFAVSFAWGISLCFIVVERRYSFKALGAFVLPVVFIIMGYAAMQSKDIRPLMPALQSSWLTIHVSTAVISYGSFGVSFALSCMYMLKSYFKGDFYDSQIPSLQKLDFLTYRVITFGYLFLTLVIITGAIWAERAWSRYWAWDPKETWSLITWIIYSAYLHVRLMKGWKGKNAALFAIVGFICVIFTYIGVNTLLPSVHSYVR